MRWKESGHYKVKRTKLVFASGVDMIDTLAVFWNSCIMELYRPHLLAHISSGTSVKRRETSYYTADASRPTPCPQTHHNQGGHYFCITIPVFLYTSARNEAVVIWSCWSSLSGYSISYHHQYQFFAKSEQLCLAGYYAKIEPGDQIILSSLKRLNILNFSSNLELCHHLQI